MSKEQDHFGRAVFVGSLREARSPQETGARPEDLVLKDLHLLEGQPGSDGCGRRSFSKADPKLLGGQADPFGREALGFKMISERR